MFSYTAQKKFSPYSSYLCDCVISLVKGGIHQTLINGEASTDVFYYLQKHFRIIEEMSHILSLDTAVFSSKMKDLQKRIKIFFFYNELCTYFMYTFATEFEGKMQLRSKNVCFLNN